MDILGAGADADDLNDNDTGDSSSRGRVGVGIETDGAGDDNDNCDDKAVVFECADCKSSSITGSGGEALGGIWNALGDWTGGDAAGGDNDSDEALGGGIGGGGTDAGWIGDANDVNDDPNWDE